MQARGETRFNSIMTDTKIQGKFYPLQPEQWLRACRELTFYSHRDMPYYITTINTNTSEIARKLSIPSHFACVRLALAQATFKGVQ
jgi:hypothetical protein